MIRTDRMKRHQRGTKPLRGRQRSLAQHRLRSAIPRALIRDEVIHVQRVLDGHEPWPAHIVDVPFCASIRGGAR